MGRQDQVWPQLGFDPEGEIGPPMIKKSLHRAGHIDRDELMDYARWQARASR